VKEQFLPIGDNQMATDPVSHLSGIAAFVQAVEAGSFTAAAVRLGLSKSAVAKNVAKLEERLGTRLLERTTRSLGLTSDGQSYYESCLKVLAELGSAEALLASRQQQPSGLLRISLPVAFGQKWIMPALLDIGQQYPGLNFDVSFTDRHVDLVEEGIDLVVRLGDPGDMASLVGRKIGPQHSLLCASPAYLAARGRPQKLADLMDHDYIVYARDGRALPWLLRDEAGRTVSLRAKPRHTISHGHALRDAALAGAGLAYLATWLVMPDLREGSLEAVLTSAGVDDMPIHLLWPHARNMVPKVRVVVDQLVEHFHPVPPWDRL
jgi:DNA-binding transcriptional LysR family regulator